MGYTKQSLKLLLKENQTNALKGNFLSIGKQSVAINETNLFLVSSSIMGMQKI